MSFAAGNLRLDRPTRLEGRLGDEEKRARDLRASRFFLTGWHGVCCIDSIKARRGQNCAISIQRRDDADRKRDSETRDKQGTRDLFKYWNGLRQGRSAPERAEIDPAAIRPYSSPTPSCSKSTLAGLFHFAFRGPRINALFDVELKGRSFADLWRTKEGRTWPPFC